MKEFLDNIGSVTEVQEENYNDSYIENKINAFVYNYFSKKESELKGISGKILVHDIRSIDFSMGDGDTYTVNVNLLECDLISLKSSTAVLKIKEDANWWSMIESKLTLKNGELKGVEGFIENVDKNILRLEALAAVYYSFCLFEAPKKDVDAIVKCYAQEFEVTYPWGGCKTNEQLVKWISGISDKSNYAHHVKNISISNIQNSEVECKVDVTYQTVNDIGEFRSMELHYEFTLQNNENGFPRISKSITTLIK